MKKKENLEIFKKLHSLPRLERIKLSNELHAKKPDAFIARGPWWWKWKCEVNVLVVADGLDFSTSGFGLSEFIHTFEDLQNQLWYNVNYKVTIAHRNAVGPNSMMVGYSFIQNRINNFNFSTSVNLDSFDQVWIFGAGGTVGGTLSTAEVKAITKYMDNGGGLFATGDHGSIGASLCAQIPRVKDMRYWDDTSNDNNTNEVSMRGPRRNDTNRPGLGQNNSVFFDNQSDNIPQEIGVRTFGAGMPHPLLSIKPSLKANGIIDIMPDHPHEGEVKPEKTFTVTNPITGSVHNISSQIIATSFVLGGSTTNGGCRNGKAPTDPHCFPSIAVFDGRPARVGRIVVDSTWHHFVNINLNGVGSGSGRNDIPGTQSGFNISNFRIIQEYYMNIMTWMSRRKFMLCLWKYVLPELLFNSQLIEANLDNPETPLEKIDPHNLMNIGLLAQETLAREVNPAFAYQFMLDMVEEVSPKFADSLNLWKPSIKEEKRQVSTLDGWVDCDKILGIAVGAGFIALRDNQKYLDKAKENSEDEILGLFRKGVEKGISIATKIMQKDLRNFNNLFINKEK